MPQPPKILRRLGALAALAALSVTLGACGHKLAHPTDVDSEALYVDAGPLTYQVQLSRELNPYAVEDRGYLAGVPAAKLSLTPNQEWFAIFLWARNETHSPHATTGSFDITDTQGNKYYPVTINSQVNPFAWNAQTLAPGATEPGPDSAPSFGATQGQEILFKLPISVYDNRPLSLEIYPSGQGAPSTVSLDL